MPVFLYVETNFLLSYATGRSQATDTILSNPPPSLQLIIPSVCFMETLTLLEGEIKRNNRLLESVRQQRAEVNRNVISPRIPALTSQWDQILIETDALFDEFKLRLLLALEVLGSIAELIHPTPEILASSRSNTVIIDPTDNLILASILDHSKKSSSVTKIFLSENRRDFDINPQAKKAIEDSGIRYFADPAQCLVWHQSRPVS